MRLKYYYTTTKYIPLATLWLICLLVFPGLGCKKLVTVDAPVTSITGANVYSTNATAAAVLTGIYTNMSAGSFATGSNSISVLSGLSADEFTLLNGNTSVDLYYYTNALSSTNVGNNDLWSNIYYLLYIANSTVQGLTNNNDLMLSVQQQLMGEALFIRAFCYFYLVNLYGDVPLVTGTNYDVNEALSRTPQTKIWQQIITDLKSAQNLLSSNYLDATLLSTTTGRVRPTKWAADALLARVYLYTGDYSDAVTEADSVIGNTSLYSLATLKNAFLANSTEAIWQLQPVTTGTTNTQDAYLFILPSSGPNTFSNPIYLSPFLLNSFETGDQRRIQWVDSVIVSPDTFYFPYKYKVNAQNVPVTEYLMVLRLGEQYLIRAEAEANGAGGGITAAIADLNAIRTRAGLPLYSGDTDQSSVLNAIYHERQVELFSEWGNRWFDLKRANIVNLVLGSPGNVCQTKGGTWNPDWQLYPITLTQLQYDPNLVQNPGYE